MAGDFIQRSRHGTVIFFRRRVPKDLHQSLGRSQIYVSLRTQILSEARARARALAVLTDRLFAEARYMETNRSQDTNVRINYGINFGKDNVGKLFFAFTDVKPGEEASVEDTARRLLGLAKPSAAPAPAHPTPTVAQAAEAILADAGLKPGTVKEYKRAFAVFAGFVGADTPLGDITQEKFWDFTKHVKSREEWAPKTQGFHITTAQRLFTFYAARNSGVPKITTVGLKPKRATPMGHDREPFTVAELEAVFSHVHKYRNTEPGKWWFPVATAFMGTRIEELAQAHLGGDFFQDSGSGIHFLQVDELVRDPSAGHSPKSVKSHAGWRKVPIHPALVNAGFIEYLETEKRAGAITPFERCWSPLRGAGRVKHSQKISKWGGKELGKLRAEGSITRSRLSYFHSMRHAFVTLMGKADVSEEWRAAITGHQFGGINAQVYNKAKQDVTLTLPKILKGLAPLEEVFRNLCIDSTSKGL